MLYIETPLNRRPSIANTACGPKIYSLKHIYMGNIITLLNKKPSNLDILSDPQEFGLERFYYTQICIDIKLLI